MIDAVARVLVLLAGGYLAALALVLLLAPARATRFLSGFARSAFTHYLELALRLIAGGAILLAAPGMLFSDFFVLFGWVLIVTTLGLVAVPWRWHRRFALWGVPFATRHALLVAVVSLAFGGFIIASAVAAPR